MTTKQFDTIRHHLGSTFEIDYDDITAALQVALDKAGIEVKDKPLTQWKLLQRDGNYAFHEPPDFDDAITECEYTRLTYPIGDRRRIDEIHCFENGEIVAKYDPVDGSRRWQKGEPNE